MSTKISVSVRKTVQEAQYEPVQLELSTEIELSSNDPANIKKYQIKLADGSNTTFDGGNPDIRYKDGGLIAPNGKKSNLTNQQY